MEVIFTDNRGMRKEEWRYVIGPDYEFPDVDAVFRFVEEHFGEPHPISKRFFSLGTDMFMRIDTRPRYKIGATVKSHNRFSRYKFERGRIVEHHPDGFYNHYIVEMPHGLRMSFREIDLLEVRLF